MKTRNVARFSLALVVAFALSLLNPTTMYPPYLLHAIYTIIALAVAALIYHERPLVLAVVFWALWAALVLQILSRLADYAGRLHDQAYNWTGEAIPFLAFDLFLFIIGACCGAYIKRKWLGRKSQVATAPV